MASFWIIIIQIKIISIQFYSVLVPSTAALEHLNTSLDISVVRKSRIKPEAAGWEARTLPLCHAAITAPHHWRIQFPNKVSMTFLAWKGSVKKKPESVPDISRKRLIRVSICLIKTFLIKSLVWNETTHCRLFRFPEIKRRIKKKLGAERWSFEKV